MQKWFKCVVNYLKIDDDGRERKVSEAYLIDAVTYTDAEARIIQQLKIRESFLIEADDLEGALKRLEEGLSYILVPYQITSLAVSNIVDVFPYFGETATETQGKAIFPFDMDEPEETE